MKMTKAMCRYLAIMFLNLLAITMGNLFINLFLMKIADDFVSVLLFNAVSFLLLCIAALLLGPLAKRTSKKLGILLGDVLGIIMYAAVILLQEQANDYVFILAVLSGLSQGFYWLSMNTLLLELADYQHRERLNALNSAGNSLCQLCGPLLAVIIVDSFPAMDGYNVLFIIIIIAMAVSVVLCTKLDTAVAPAPYTLRKAVRIKGFHQYVQACVLCAEIFFRDGAIPSLLNVLIFHTVKSSAVLSGYLSYMTLLSLLTYYSFAHFHFSRRRLFTYGTFGCIIAMILLGMGLGSHLQIFLFVTIFGIASPICMYQMTIAAQQTAYRLDPQLSYTMEYTIIKEGATGIGRISACFILYGLYVSSMDFRLYGWFSGLAILISLLSLYTYRRVHLEMVKNTGRKVMNMKEKIIEICCVNYEDCIHADANGADRIELCASMAAGGLTPSLGLFQMVKEHVRIPVMVMIRPRGDGFCYQEPEYEIMKKDVEIFLSNGADGCVFGILNPDKTVDTKRTKELAAVIHKYGKEAVFHRAFDECPDKETAIQELISCGIDRILTAGGQGNAEEHLEELNHWQKTYGGNIQLQVCGSIRSHNAVSIAERTNIEQLHSACRMFCQDVSDEPAEELGYHNAYDCVDAAECRRLVACLR